MRIDASIIKLNLFFGIKRKICFVFFVKTSSRLSFIFQLNWEMKWLDILSSKINFFLTQDFVRIFLFTIIYSWLSRLSVARECNAKFSWIGPIKLSGLQVFYSLNDSCCWKIKRALHILGDVAILPEEWTRVDLFYQTIFLLNKLTFESFIIWCLLHFDNIISTSK